MFKLGSSIGYSLSLQVWVPNAAPRYRGTWESMIVVSWVGTPAIVYVLRFILVRNKNRKGRAAKITDDCHEGTVVELDEDGQIVRRRVSLEMLDLTDFENRSFIYPLQRQSRPKVSKPQTKSQNFESVRGILQHSHVLAAAFHVRSIIEK